MRALWIGLPIFLLLVSSVVWAGKIDPRDEQWNRTHIDLHFLKNYVENVYPCYESPKHFLACDEMIHSLIEAHPAPGPSRFEEQQRRVALLQSITLNWKAGDHPIDFMKLADERLAKPGIGNARAIGEAINKMIRIHDWHAELGPTAQTADERTMVSAELSTDGIGVILNDDGDINYIQHVYKNSPAQKAGLQVGDELVAVDGKSTMAMPIDAVVDLLLGRPRTSVTVEVRRANDKHKIAKIKRAHFETPDVVEQMVTDMGRPILNIMVSSFLDDLTCPLVKEALKDSKKAEAIVLDLRGNGGGLAEQAQCVVGLFVGKRLAFSVRALNINRNIPAIDGPNIATEEQVTDQPLVVLIDSETSSTAEIVAGALQDYKRAWIVGERSQGKGTIQEVRFENQYLLSKKTVAEYFLPSGRSLQALGIRPDYEVSRQMNPDPSRHVMREADYYPFSLPATNPIDQNIRQSEIDGINEHCLTAKRAENLFATNAFKGSATDLQLYKAEEILSCSHRQAAR